MLDAALLLGYRLIWGTTHWIRTKQAISQHRPVLVIGAGPVGQNEVQLLRRFAQADIESVGYLDDDPTKLGEEQEGLLVLGSLEMVELVIELFQVQDAVVKLPLHAHQRLVLI